MKKFVPVFLTICMSLPMYAQFESFRFSSDNQELIRKTVEQGLVLIRQEYQLEDTLTGKRYTLDNRPEFGSVTAMGVRTRNGFILPEKVLQPWIGDKNYRNFKAENLIPVLSKTSIRSAGDTVWLEAPLLAPYDVAPLADTAWVEASDSSSCGNGFTVGVPDSRDAWIVWLTSETDNLESPGLSLVVYRYELPDAVDEDRIIDVKNVNTKASVLGGVVVVPVFETIGCVDFMLRGVITGQPDAWKLVLLDGGVDDSDGSQDNDGPVQLTPVEQTL